MSLIRFDGRNAATLRPVIMVPHYLDYAEGSVFIKMGRTRVLCAVSVEEKVPDWLKGSGRGWVTAEYSLLPRSTHTRTARESVQGRISGRTQEISRLIGRSLRAAVNLWALGERMCTVDCDVIQADGGTRTAAITGGYVALALALRKLIGAGIVPPEVLKVEVAAVSVGLVDGVPMLDLCYDEDSRADVDLNVVMTSAGEYVEIQGTAEGRPLPRRQLDVLLDLAEGGIRELIGIQRQVLEKDGPARAVKERCTV